MDVKKVIDNNVDIYRIMNLSSLQLRVSKITTHAVICDKARELYFQVVHLFSLTLNFQHLELPL